MSEMNKYRFWAGTGWCLYLFCGMFSLIGEHTGGPYLITWWDMLWIPFMIGLFPFFLGMLVFYEKGDL